MYQWMCLQATKANGEKFAVWLLGESTPSEDLTVARETTSRYILQIEDGTPLEFQDRFTGEPVLPKLGAWQYLFPKPTDKTTQNELFPQTVKYLGHTYRLTDISDSGESAESPGHAHPLSPSRCPYRTAEQHKAEGRNATLRYVRL